jgi:hypothetical protein
MKKIFMMTIFGLLAASVILAGGSSEQRGGNIGQENMSILVKTETANISEINEIIINAEHIPVTVGVGVTERIVVRQYGNSDTSPISYRLRNSKLIIKIGFRLAFFSAVNTDNDRIEIDIPQNFQGKIDLSTTSGIVSITASYNLGNVRLRSDSGNLVVMGRISANSIDLRTKSGHIEINELTSTGTINIHSESGRITANNNIIAQDIDIKTISGGFQSFGLISAVGNITVNSENGVIIFNEKVSAASFRSSSTSGGVSIRTAEIIDCSISSESGSIAIGLNSSSAFEFEARTESGIVNTYFDTNRNGRYITAIIGDVPSMTVKVRTISGGVTINKNEGDEIALMY